MPRLISSLTRANHPKFTRRDNHKGMRHNAITHIRIANYGNSLLATDLSQPLDSISRIPEALSFAIPTNAAAAAAASENDGVKLALVVGLAVAAWLV